MILSVVILLVLVLIDQATKFLVETTFTSQLDRLPFDLIPGFIECKYSQNTGIAFSLFESFPIFLTILNTIIIAILLFYFFKKPAYSQISSIAYILIISGGLSNLLDRFIRGYVVDFINPTFIDFAIFNLADCFLNIGVFLLIWELFFDRKKRA